MTERRVLIVCYYFPPIAGVGVQRTLKHTTYLPRAGWTPAVIAPRGAVYRVMDQASVASLPAGLEVHRSFCYEPARLRRDASRLARLLGGSSSGASPDRLPGSGRHDQPLGRLPGILNRAWARAVRLLFFPDDQLLWVPFAAASAIAAHRRNPAHAIYSSSPPISTHLVAGLVKARTGLPWIADFRDPWIGNSFASPLPGFQGRLQARLERWIVHAADRVVFATPGLRERYAARYPRQAERMAVISNGYDGAELALVPEPPAGDGLFRLAYTGSLYGKRELALLVEGLALAVERTPDLRARLRVELIGWMTAPNRAAAESAAARLAPILELSGFVPRQVALARLRAADAALLLLADGPDRDLFVGAKLFEYLGLSRQVLAVAPPGDARRILDELGWGIVTDPRPESVAAAIDRLVSSPAPDRAADPEGRYEQSRLAAQLGALLDEVVGEGALPAAQS